MICRLEYNGVTVDLNVNGRRVLGDYAPAVGGSSEREISDQLTLGVRCATRAELAERLADVERAFDWAREHAEGAGGCYLVVGLDEDGWRSRVVDGEVSASLRAAAGYESGLVTAVVRMQRWNWFEGAEAYLPLSNLNGTGVTDGLRVYSAGDGSGGEGAKRDLSVSIAGADVAGTLPAACRIEMTATYEDGSARNGDVYMGHDVRGIAVPIIEGETILFNGSSSAAAGYSGGAVGVMLWSGADWSLLGGWTLSTALLNAVRGGWVRVLGLTGNGGGADVRYKLAVTDGVVTLQEGEVVRGKDSGTLVDLGTLQLPPYLTGSGDVAPLELWLYGKADGTGSHAVSVDYWLLLGPEQVRVLHSTSYGWDTDTRLVDDGIEDALYTDGWTPAGKVGNYVGLGERVELVPGRDQTLRFWWAGGIEKHMDVRVAYRPRRRGL